MKEVVSGSHRRYISSGVVALVHLDAGLLEMYVSAATWCREGISRRCAPGLAFDL